MEKLVLIEDQVFLVSDELGDVPFGNNLGLGLYYLDTRFLSVFDLTINNSKPILLSGSAEQNFMGHLQMANPAWLNCSGEVVRSHTVSIRRNRFVDCGLEERIGLFNYNPFPVDVELVLLLAADFKDMFQVRGLTREPNGKVLAPSQGKILAPEYQDSTISLNYLGLDDVRRRTDIVFETPPTSLEFLAGGSHETTTVIQSASCATAVAQKESLPPGVKSVFRLILEPNKPYSITMYVRPAVADEKPRRSFFDIEVKELRDSYERWFAECTSIETDNEFFNRMLRRGQSDLRALLTYRPTGLFPSAGIPWFAAPFGRDALITSLQTMMLNSDIAVGTLRFLALHQGKEVSEWRDEQPGKIMHETRVGEMSRRGAVPHTPYYGSVDSTPLFLILFSEAMDWLDDDDLYAELLPSAMAALEWIDEFGDVDGDGYIEYQSLSPRGLRNQGWKDSRDSFAFPNGEPAEPPIACIEAQGYVYDAKLRLAKLLARKGDGDLATRLRDDAERLRERFAVDFWMEEERYCAQGLDRDKRQIPSVTSEAGHCLWSGILKPDQASVVADRLLAPDLFSGWGIRTLSSRSPNFNPMSYHNGSVWPHDNSIVAAGLKSYGLDEYAIQTITGIFLAGLRFRYGRLPELFCGFDRDLRYQSMPAEYPVSCSPQAWATGAPVFFLHTILGIRADAAERKIYLRPTLPGWLNEVVVRNLRVGKAKIDILVNRAGITTARQSGDLDVIVDDSVITSSSESINLAPTCMQKMPFFV
ncbi:MAG: amylo-alpha-1,6-glucosidase [Chloroflexi bacterium]|nr:amylo-alpha-1,6-glucosidase [Chloroflexota bacterium]